MSRRAFTLEQKTEAITLAGLVGVRLAGDTLGIDFRTITTWSKQAGHRSEIDVEPDVWRRLHDGATRRVEAMLATGKLTASQTATVAAIAKRNMSAPVARPAAPTDVELYIDWVEEWIAATYPDTSLDVAIAACLADRRLSEGDPNGAVDIPTVIADLVATHGSIEAAREWQSAETTRQWQAQIAINRAKVEEMRIAAIQAALDDETRELIAAAEAFLAKGEP